MMRNILFLVKSMYVTFCFICACRENVRQLEILLTGYLLYMYIINIILHIYSRVFAIRAQQPILKCVWAKRAQQQKVLFWQNLYLFSVECFEYIKQSYKDTFKCNVLIHHLYSWIVNGILKNVVEPFWQNKTIYIGFF